MNIKNKSFNKLCYVVMAVWAGHAAAFPALLNESAVQVKLPATQEAPAATALGSTDLVTPPEVADTWINTPAISAAINSMLLQSAPTAVPTVPAVSPAEPSALPLTDDNAAISPNASIPAQPVAAPAASLSSTAPLQPAVKPKARTALLPKTIILYPIVPKPNPPQVFNYNGQNIPFIHQLFNQAKTLFYGNQFAASEQRLMQIQRIAPEHAGAYAYLAKIAFQRHRCEQAEAFARRGLLFAQTNGQRRAFWEIILQAAQVQHQLTTIKEAKRELALLMVL